MAKSRSDSQGGEGDPDAPTRAGPRAARARRAPTAAAPASSVADPGTPRDRRRRRNAAIRRGLIEAAARVVGEHGYGGASIARITAEAGVAHGAFYLHFESQQALFDILLPHIGEEMIDSIGRAVRDAGSLEEIERRGIRANFAYLEAHPELRRILREAEAFAPEAYASFLGLLHERYLGSLRRSLAEGQIRGFSDSDLEVVSTMLMGARDFLIQRYTASDTGFAPLTDAVAEVYLRFVLAGLGHAHPASRSGHAPAAPEAATSKTGAAPTAGRRRSAP
ncbi:MAG: TetR/AcrR family transcriptional regulator [Alkalilacustris sp.]